jgi:hypothetical protein
LRGCNVWGRERTSTSTKVNATAERRSATWSRPSRGRGNTNQKNWCDANRKSTSHGADSAGLLVHKLQGCNVQQQPPTRPAVLSPTPWLYPIFPMPPSANIAVKLGLVAMLVPRTHKIGFRNLAQQCRGTMPQAGGGRGDHLCFCRWRSVLTVNLRSSIDFLTIICALGLHEQLQD